MRGCDVARQQGSGCLFAVGTVAYWLVAAAARRTVRVAAVEVRHLVGSAAYWLRPYDMIADARRWRWSRRAECGSMAAARLRSHPAWPEVEAAARRYMDGTDHS